GAGQTGLVGEEPAHFELHHPEAQPQAGAEDDPRRGTEAEGPVETGAPDLGVPPWPGADIGVGGLPDRRGRDRRLQHAGGLPAAHRAAPPLAGPARSSETIAIAASAVAASRIRLRTTPFSADPKTLVVSTVAATTNQAGRAKRVRSPQSTTAARASSQIM